MDDVDGRMVCQSIGDRLEGLADDVERLVAEAFEGGDVDLAQTLYGVGLHVAGAREWLAAQADA